MNRLLQGLALLGVWVLSVGAFAAPGLPSKSTSESGVTVKVTPRDLAGPVWEFEVVFDTHWQDLADDPAKSAVLVPDDRAPMAPAGWEGAGPGGHHRSGVLRFKAVAPPPREIELRIERPGESMPRSFRWSLR